MNVYIKSPSLSRGGDFYCLLAGGEAGNLISARLGAAPILFLSFMRTSSLSYISYN